MAKKLRIQGDSINNTELLFSEFTEIKEVYSISNTRDSGKLKNIDAGDDDILCIQFEDGGEWIGHIDDYYEIFGNKPVKRSEQDHKFPTSIQLDRPQDRGAKDIVIKLIQLITKKKGKELANKKEEFLAQKIDEK